MIYKIQLSDISQNGALCKNPKIDWEHPGCPDIVCGTEGSNVLTINVPDNCVDKCVYAIVDCTDECGLCEPQRIKICPCTAAGDCPDCHQCVDNLCVSNCPENWVCQNETCVECDGTHPCPEGKVCNNGVCDCPPDKPFKDERGNCSDCSESHPCPPCFKCTPEGCVPIVCQTGVCDPETNECVECVGALQCAPNECCVNGLCECCDGFTKDPISGGCVPAGCKRDGDCPDCYTCAPGIGCVPRQCPDGYINIGSGQCCVKECNCDNPSCPTLENCLPASSVSNMPGLEDKCFCAPCYGPCAGNGDCGPGCYCDGTQCRTNPCQGDCVSGSDCGSGCGCFNGKCLPCSSASCATGSCTSYNGCECDSAGNCVESPCSGPCAGAEDCGPGCGCVNGKCVSCQTLDCAQCASVPGCSCLNGTDCVESPCSSPCANGGDCGQGCGCLNGQCESCEQYSCVTSQQCPNGCFCNNGTCQSSPCASTVCSEQSDCGIGCFCQGGQCLPCPPNDPLCGNNIGCTDGGRLFAEGCKLTAEYITQGCCACDPISMGVDIVSYANGILSLTAALRNGSADDWTTFGTLLPLTGNDLPVAGKVKFTLVVDGVTKTKTIDLTGTSGPVGFDFTGITAPSIGVQLYAEGAGNGQIWLGNVCKFLVPNSQILNSKDFTGVAQKDWSRELPIAPGADCRPPKFRWYRGTSASNMTLIYERTSTQFGPSYGTFRDSLERPADPLLEYGYFYAFESDCGCNKERKFFSCLAPNGTATKFQPCVLDPDSEVTITTCGATIDFTNGVEFDCSVLTGSAPLDPPQFEVLVNGTVIGTYTWSGGYAIQPATSIPAPPGGIETVRVRLKGSTCPCFKDFEIEEAGQFRLSANPVGGAGCGTTDFAVNMIAYPAGAPTSGLPYTATAEVDGVPVALTSGGPFYSNSFTLEVPAAAAGTYVFTVTNAQGCSVVTPGIVFSPILANPFSFTSSCYDDGGTPYVSIVVTNGAGVTADVTFNGNPLLPSVPANGSRTYSGLAANVGTVPIVIEASGDPTCVLNDTVNTRCCIEDANSAVTTDVVNIDLVAQTFDVQVTFTNNTAIPQRYFMCATNLIPPSALADSLGNQWHVLAPSGTTTVTYQNLPFIPAGGNSGSSYLFGSQWTDFGVVPNCFVQIGIFKPGCDLFENLVHNTGVFGVTPPSTTDHTTVSIWSLCYTGSPGQPAIYVQNDTPYNMAIYFDNVLQTTVPSNTWSGNLGTTINALGTHTWKAVVDGNNACSKTVSATVDCGAAPPPPPGSECTDIEARTVIGNSFNNPTSNPACQTACPAGYEVCLTMCCGYNGAPPPFVPTMLLRNETGYAVEVRVDNPGANPLYPADGTLLVQASPSQNFAASTYSFVGDFSNLPVKFIVYIGGDPTCIYTDTVTWACNP